MSIKDYYSILGVSHKARQEEIKQSYKKLIFEYHPDKFKNHPSHQLAEEKLRELNEAYEVLSNPLKRKIYDRDFSSSQHADSVLISKLFREVSYLFERKDYDRARAELEKILNIDPHIEKANFLMGLCYINQEHFGKGQIFFEKTIKINGENHEALNMLGICCFRHRDFDRALYYHKKAARIAPYEYLYMENIAHVLWREKKTDEALKYFLKAREKAPDRPELCMYICYLYNETGYKEKSTDYFKKAKKLGPGHPMVEEWEEEHYDRISIMEHIHHFSENKWNDIKTFVKNNVTYTGNSVKRYGKNIKKLYKDSRNYSKKNLIYMEKKLSKAGEKSKKLLKDGKSATEKGLKSVTKTLSDAGEKSKKIYSATRNVSEEKLLLIGEKYKKLAEDSRAVTEKGLKSVTKTLSDAGEKSKKICSATRDVSKEKLLLLEEKSRCCRQLLHQTFSKYQNLPSRVTCYASRLRIRPIMVSAALILVLSVLIYKISDREAERGRTTGINRTNSSQKELSLSGSPLTETEKHIKFLNNYIICKDYISAKKELHKLLKLNIIKSDKYIELGEIFLKNKDYKNSLDCVEYALKKEPSNIKALRIAAGAYLGGGNYKNAIETNKKILSLQPSDRESSMNVALAYYRQKGYKSSITWSEKALALNLTEGEKKAVNSILFDSLLNQGRLMTESKKYREGEKYFLEALNIKKNNLSARKELAGCYLHIGINYLDKKNRKEGKKYFNKVIGLNTGGDKEKQARHYIASMTPGKNKNIQIASKEEHNKEIAYNYEKTREDNYTQGNNYKENIPSYSNTVKETKVVAPAEAKTGYEDIKLEDGGEDSKL